MNINEQDQEYLKKLTVLYVEDDDDTREQFIEFLQRPVGRLVTACNGAEGFEAFIQHSPDIVVTDILMPVKDGLAMAYDIRSAAPSVPIIVVTAFEQTDYLMRAINIGIDKYVVKPVNSYLLFENLLECAHRLRAEEQLQLEKERNILAMKMKHHETVSIMAGGIAHNYNNLLQSILGFVTLAKMSIDPASPAFKYLETAEDGYAKATGLSNMLMILGSEPDLPPQAVPLVPVVRGILGERIKDATVTYEFLCEDESVPVAYSEQQIRVLFGNLVTNALEAMPSGGALIVRSSIQALAEQDGLPLAVGSYLRISLADNGIGIARDVLPMIFEPYYSTKQKGAQHGVGLSLAICKTIAIKHGGYISVESEPGKGATFHVWFPVAR